MQQQLYDQVREISLAGSLAPGTRLPSSRALASELGCSRNTVVGAFDQLLSEGYLEGQAGSGTFVSRVLPEDLLGLPPAEEIGRASCRERVCQYVSISVVAVSLKKKEH